MSTPSLTPASTVSAKKLSSTGVVSDVASAVSYGVYNNDNNFLSGAADQVKFVYNRLGGNMLDIEIEASNVYDSYEAAVLEYSRIINNHQAKNVLSSFLGTSTGTFDHHGELTGPLSASLSGSNPATFYPRFTFHIADRASLNFSEQTKLNGTLTHYSASIQMKENIQQYDLQDAIDSAASSSSELFSQEYKNSKNKRINITRVYFRSPSSVWRFYGYYGGLSVVGNLNTYGQFSDDSTFEVVPVWQNKLQAIMYETNLYTRASHYSYELRNNIIKLYPPPPRYGSGLGSGGEKLWFEFTFSKKDPLEDAISGTSETKGVNNINSLPFANIAYSNINSMGKDWIKWYSLALCKETLGQVRSKLASLPIPGNEITLNGPALLAEAKEEKQILRDSLIKDLDELVYKKLAETEAEIAENAEKVKQKVPLPLFIG